MGIALKVAGANVNLELKNYEIRGYEFDYSVGNSKYAKSSEDNRELVIIGDISKIIEKNKTILTLIRNWAKHEYEDSSYYNSVTITHTYSDEVIREITFPNAFIKEYKETIDTHTGHGIFRIALLQKFDKREEIEIEPVAPF
jgi:uncharacterized FlaG/YvyC family protein